MSADPLSNNGRITPEVVVAIFRNWRDELIKLFLERIAPHILSQRDRAILHAGPGKIEAILIREGESRSLGAVALGPEKSGALELSVLLRNAGVGSDIELELPEDCVLRPQLTIPKTGRRALEGVLRYEIERISPVNPAELYYDFAAGMQLNGIQTIELRIVRKAPIDELLQLCRAAGLAVAGIRFADDERPADWRRFPLDRKAFLRSLWSRFGCLALGGLAVLLLFLLLFAAHLRGTAAMSALSETVTDAGVRAARVERLQRVAGQTAKNLAFATQEKKAPLLVGILAELTRLLPDGTWINELTIDGAKVRILGSSSEASNLIGTIDRSPRFANAKFEAPLVREPSSKTERFDISFDVRGRQ
jgi:general secretion pathway protein L